LFYFLCFWFVACSDDIESRIEGQWQLKTMEENGVVSQVDTVFYSFMRGRVFSYTLLTNPDETLVYYGYVDNLSEEKIPINIDNAYIDDLMKISDWQRKQRTFDVLHVNDKNLTLSADNKIYSFKRH
jgi:hypothetical protein